MTDDLAELLPGWIEPVTELVLRERAGGDRARLADVVRDAWECGELRQEDGMWWCGPGVAAGGAAVAFESAAPVVDTMDRMRALCDEGRPDEALRLALEESSELLARGASDGTDAQLGAIALASLFALLDAGRVHVVLAAAESLHAESVVRRSRTGQGWAAVANGTALLAAGRVLDARRAFTEARLVARLTGDARLSTHATDGLMAAYLLVGEPAPVLTAPNLPPSTPVADAPGHGQVRALAWRHASAANLTALAAAAEDERRAGRHGIAASLAGDLALLGDPERALKILASVGPLDGDILPMWAPIAEALVAGDAVAIADFADRLDDLGLTGLASAFTLRAVALRIDAGDDGDDTRALLAVANRRARQVQLGAEFLAQFRSLLPLREREHEIAQLAADGLTNKQIAEQLVISLRTVENHLYRVYDKLGIEGRDELRTLLGK